MSKRDAIGPWDIWRVRGEVREVWSSPAGEVVLLGQPPSDDAEHNCDALGCEQDHVLWRGRMTSTGRVDDPKESP
jgi:hypothetical protein